MFRTVLAVTLFAATAMPAAAQAWTYTGGDGQLVELEAAPVRIIAHQDATAGLILTAAVNAADPTVAP